MTSFVFWCFLISTFTFVVLTTSFVIFFFKHWNQPSYKGYSWMYNFLFVFGRISIPLQQHKVQLEHIKLSSKYDNIPKELKDLKIIQISDLHYERSGNFCYSNKVFKKSIDVINKEEPDFVFITGDIINFLSSNMVSAKEVSSLIKTIKCKNIFGVLGSHDTLNWKSQFQETKKKVKKIFEESGMKILDNEYIELPKLKLRLYGFGSYIRRDVHIPKVSLNEHNAKYFNIALSHNPDSFKLLKRVSPQINLMISGHTHAGQAFFPFTKKPIFPVLRHVAWKVGFERLGKWKISSTKKIVKNWGKSNGLFDMGIKNWYMYVNRGLGSHFNLRLFCRPEITVFTF